MWYKRLFLSAIVLQASVTCYTVQCSENEENEPDFLKTLWEGGIETAGDKFLKDAQNFKDQEYPDTTPEPNSEYDFIVIGAGTAGCVLAARLTENKNATVLLLEAGGHEKFLFAVPFIADNLNSVDYISWDYLSEPSDKYCRGMKERRCRLPRAKVMGGCNTHNGIVVTRGAKVDYDLWAELGNKGWDWESVLPYFKKLENVKIPELQNNPNRNTKGPLPIAYTDYISELGEAFLAANAELGYKSIDYNANLTVGYSKQQGDMDNSERYTTNRAYLHANKKRKNLQVSLYSLVNKILINKKKQAWGVEFIKNNKTYIVKARKEVILSAGAMGSPQILMLSGIGPKDHLKELDIDVIKNAPVGKNLMDHIAYGGLSFLVNTTIGYNPDDLNNKTLLSQYFNDRVGKLTSISGNEVVAYVDVSDPNNLDGLPDIEIQFGTTSLAGSQGMADNWNITDELFQKHYAAYEGVSSWTARGLILRPKSRGEILLRSKNIHDHPKLIPNYLSHPDDVKTIIGGIRKVIELSKTKAMQKYGSKFLNPTFEDCKGLKFNSDKYWECAIRTITVTIYHYSGTCKMGPKKDPSSVVDPNLKVIGVKNLRVIDVSIIPVIPSAHTNLPTVMIAEKGADIVKKAWGYPVDPLS